jgi:nitroreductase
MSRVNQLINQRHTTRLMDNNISDEDVATILDSTRRAPSKNKIYGYKVFVLTNTDRANLLKKELCENVTKYLDDGAMVYLRQVFAPLVMIFMATPAPEHQMLNIKEVPGKSALEVYNHNLNEVISDVDRIAMTKNSIRDAMISATYAQLTAEDLGYGTAYVACGIEGDLTTNSEFAKLWKENFGEDYLNQSLDPVVILCIGPKSQKILDLYAGTDNIIQEPYLNGVTDYKRKGREESFLINIKQQNMIVTI